MKKLYTSLMTAAMSLFMFGALSAQSITCGSNQVYPEGGGNYPNSANETWLVEPETPGDIVTITFNSFGTESCCDHLFVYEGDDASGVQLANLVGTSLPESISSASGLFLNFTSDGSVTNIGFDLDVSCSTPDNSFVAYSIPEQTGAAIIDAENHTVTVEATFGTDLSDILPSFELSVFAETTVGGVSQESGVNSNDFSTPVTYSITAPNGEIQDWVVTITVADGASDAKDIIAYSINGVDATVGTNTVDLSLSAFVDITSQVAVFESSPFSTVAIAGVDQESGVTENNFSSSLIYTVTAQDGSTKDYVVTAIQEDICGASIDYPAGDGSYPNNANESWVITPDAEGDIVTIDFTAFATESCCDHLFVYDGTDDSGTQLADLVGTSIPESISSASGLYLNFTSDGSVTQTGFELNISCTTPDNSIVAFSIPEETGAATIDDENHTVTLEATFGTDLTALIPSFDLSIFATVTVGGVDQQSGVTSNDFTESVTYTVMGSDGSTQDWVVSITVAGGASDAKDILAFSIDGVDGTIGDNTVDLNLNAFVDLSDLTAIFESSPFSTVAIAGDDQESGVTANNFTDPVIYTVTAQDESTKDYTVTVTKDPICGSSIDYPVGDGNYPNSANESWIIVGDSEGDVVTIDFTSFATESCCDHLFVYDGTDDTGTQLANLVGTSLPASFSSANGLYLNFTSDGSVTQTGFELNISCETPENDIIAFSFPEQTGDAIIDTENYTVELELSFGTDLSNLVASYELSPFATASVDGIEQESGATINNFSGSLTYTVTASNGATQDWVVTATVAATASDSKDILAYSINGVDGTIGENTVDLNLDAFTDLSNLTAVFESSPFSTVAIAGEEQESGATANDFTTALIYTVTAQDGSTKEYTVTVTKDDICGATIDYPAGAGNYSNNANESWIITPDPGSDVVTIDFSSFGTESCCDHLFVYAGTDNSGELLADLVGTSIPASISSESGLFLNFTSDVSVTQTGFVLDVLCQSSASELLSFSFAEETAAAVIDPEAYTIDVEVAFGTDLTALVADFTISELASINIAGDDQESGVTENDFSAAVVYTVVAESGDEQDWTVTVTNAATPWTYDITGSSHTILIPGALDVSSLEGVTLEAGDFFGIFYTADGALVNAGVEEWTGSNVVITAYGSDGGENNGFQSGETFMWMIWDTSEGTATQVNVTYEPISAEFPNQGEYADNGISGLLGAMTYVEVIEELEVALRNGWGLMSSFMAPDNNELETIMTPIVDDLVIFKNGLGDVYWPQYGINTVGGLTPGEGYFYNHTGEGTLVLDGTQIIPEDTPLTFVQGWSIIGYLRTSAASIETLMEPIADNIFIVKDEDGAVYWPEFDVNGIANMQPGKGYQIKMISQAGYTYPSNQDELPLLRAEKAMNEVYSHTLQTANNMTIGIPSGALDGGFVYGDEIGVFDAAGTLVGSTVYTDGNMAVSVWGDDEITTSTKEGMAVGEGVHFRLYRDGQEHAIAMDWSEGNGSYESNAVMMVANMRLSGQASTAVYELSQNEPNPSNGSTRIHFFVPENVQVKISVFNILGEEVSVLTNEQYETGYHNVLFETSSEVAGTYFYRMTAGDFTATKQMNIIK